MDDESNIEEYNDLYATCEECGGDLLTSSHDVLCSYHEGDEYGSGVDNSL